MSEPENRRYRLTTGLGVFGVAFTDRGVCRITFPSKAPHNAQELRGQEKDTGRVLRDALQTYATGRKVAFNVQLDLSAGTEFQQKIWRTLRSIPFGQVWTYAQVAKKVGKPRSARAVGEACKKNPVLIVVPCHRVIGTDGSMTGFAGGVALKKKLLRLEGYKP